MAVDEDPSRPATGRLAECRILIDDILDRQVYQYLVVSFTGKLCCRFLFDHPFGIKPQAAGTNFAGNHFYGVFPVGMRLDQKGWRQSLSVVGL
jgi:hypothetical protein